MISHGHGGPEIMKLVMGGSDVRTPVFSGFGRSRVFFGEHRAVRVFFYRTSGGPGFQQSQNSGGRANFSSNNQST